MDTYSRKKDLLRKYLNDDCSRDELEELLNYLRSEEEERYEEITAELWAHIREDKRMEERKADLLIEHAINAGTFPKGRRYGMVRWYQVAAAAILILLAGVGMRYLFSQVEEEPVAMVKHATNRYKNDVKPGGTKAILKAGHAQVVLNKKDTSFVLAGNTVDIQEGDVKVTRGKPVQYTLITPRGGEYSLVLADGTRVWLNADSKLIYPSVFNGNTREVQLTGEAYFDVKTDARHPFIVHTGRQDIRVLGTAFNIQAYPDEHKSVTTLVKGKVEVHTAGQQAVLKPGQQALLDGEGTLGMNPDADVKQAVAWKEGYFRFDFTDIHEIMRQLSRWYDVEVSYEKGVGHKEFLAFINRDNNISEVLEMLEGTGEIRFKIEGKKVTVMRGGQE